MWELRSRVRRSRSAAAATVREEEEVERNHDEVTATMDVVETEGNYVNPIIIEEVEEIPTPNCENVRRILPNLHQDIMLNIIIRLPVKSILRFRCVSKAWCKLLKDPQFVRNHLNHGIKTNKFSLMVLNFGLAFCYNDSTVTHTLAYDPLLSTLSDPVHIDYPFIGDCFGVKFWGTCNGLVCATLLTALSNTGLWNPTTREFKEVPAVPTTLPMHEYNYHNYAFGYDDKIDDYKVISFVGFENESLCEVQVYTVKSNSWRRLQNTSFELCAGCLHMQQVSVNGATHWLASTDSKAGPPKVIASFDFKDERFNEMSLPHFCDKYHEAHLKLCSLGGSLCLLGSVDYSPVDVWEMKEYRLTESWAKLFTFNHDAYIMEFSPLQFVNNGEVLLGYDAADGYHLDLYDIKHGTTTHLKAHDPKEDYAHLENATAFVYAESLVTLNSGTFVGLHEIGDSEADARTVDLDSINSSAHVGGVESGDLEDDDASEEDDEEEENEIAERFCLSPKSVSPQKCCQKCTEFESRKLELEYKKLDFKIREQEDEHMSKDTSKMNALQLEWWQLRANEILEKCRGSGMSIGDVNDGKEENGVSNPVKQGEDIQTKKRKRR